MTTVAVIAAFVALFFAAYEEGGIAFASILVIAILLCVKFLP